MVYKLKIYVKGMRKIDLVCDEEFFKTLQEDLENIDVQFMDLNNLIIPKRAIKRIVVNSVENNVK